MMNRRFHELALLVVACGAVVGMGAVAYAWLTRGQFAGTTFLTSLLALSMAEPVLRDYLEMRRASSEKS